MHALNLTAGAEGASLGAAVAGASVDATVGATVAGGAWVGAAVAAVPPHAENASDAAPIRATRRIEVRKV